MINFPQQTTETRPEIDSEYFTPPDEFRLRDLNLNLSVWNYYFKPFDIIDAAIVAFIVQMCAAHRESIHRWQADGHEWTRIHPAHIKKGMPILKITSNRSIQRRIAKILDYDPIGTGAIMERRLWDAQSIPAYRITAAADILTWVLPDKVAHTSPERAEGRARYKEKLKSAIINPYTSTGKRTGTQPSANDAKCQTISTGKKNPATVKETATCNKSLHQDTPPDFKVAPPDFKVAGCDFKVAQYKAYKGVHIHASEGNDCIDLNKILTGMDWLINPVIKK